MIAAVARALMALAVHMLGEHQRDWALAFAIGCLITACRELPRHEGGRFAVASHIFALGIIVPVAALTVTSLLTGFPSSYLGHIGVHDLLEVRGGAGPLLNEGNSFAIPALALLVSVLAMLHLRIAWLALERDWTRLAAVGALSAAVTAALLICSAVIFADFVAPLAQVAVLAVELTAAAALARWHAQLPAAASPVPSR